MDRKELGRKGELFARQYLEGKGYRFVTANWSCKIGELDLVMYDRREMVVVEVKTRLFSSSAQQRIFNTITYQKQKKLRILSYILQERMFPRHKFPIMRIDVVGVLVNQLSKRPVHFEHIKAAIEIRD